MVGGEDEQPIGRLGRPEEIASPSHRDAGAAPVGAWAGAGATTHMRRNTHDHSEAARITPGRPDGTIQQAEEAGLVFAFRARCLATLIVALAILVLVPWPRNLYYLAFAVGFYFLGYVPFRLRRHRHAEVIKLGFVVLDVCLITAAVLNFPSGGVS
ncbi:MAG: adenylate/guanylate cyclase protein, partial [Microvirga sp.]|nr:adenylate/guanylate cyclase protein [Microvirga sp.]